MESNRKILMAKIDIVLVTYPAFLFVLMSFPNVLFIILGSKLGPWIAKRRAQKVSAKYSEIGGGSPILKWTKEQGSLLVQLLNERRKESSPHKFYIGFRYAEPLLEEALHGMERYTFYSLPPFNFELFLT